MGFPLNAKFSLISDQLTLCILMCQKVIQITMPNLKKIGSEMSENLAFKGNMVRFGLDWFGLVCFFVFHLVKVVLVSIRTKFELSMCLCVCVSECLCVYVS